MKRQVKFHLLVMMLFLQSCKSERPNEQIEILTHFSQLEEAMDKYSDRALVINFWATTCPPCIKEMPHFKTLEEHYSASQLKVLLVNLDLRRDFEKRVIPFVEKRKISPEVFMLADENYSAWTDKIDSSWFGALPATLITYKGEKKFRFGLYETFEDLDNDVKGLLGK